MLRYQALKYFTVVAQYQNLTRAAEVLYLSQSGLSVHMKNLEKELGVTLFARTNRNVQLTPAGQALYDWAMPFFEKEEEVIRAVRQAAMGENQQISIGTVGANITYFLSDMIARFREGYGDIPVAIQRMNMDPLSEALQKGTVDIGFQFLSHDLPSEFEYHLLEQGKMVLAVHKSSPLASKERVSYADLKNVPIACLTTTSAAQPRELLIRRCADLGFKPNIVAEFEYVEPLLTMVNMGSCVTVTSDLAPLNGLENVCYVELEESAGIELAMVWHRDIQNAAARMFIRHVKESSL